MSQRRTAVEMFPLIEALDVSSMTRVAFAAEHDVPVPVLDYWRRRYARHVSLGGFIEIAPHSLAAEHPVSEIVFLNGVRVRFFAPVEPVVLCRLALSAGRAA